ncbi:MAG: right-handed parallel beta-helix repeat-containing protein [Anaerolineales bacterium]
MNVKSAIPNNELPRETGRIRSLRPAIWKKIYNRNRFLAGKILRPLLAGLLFLLAIGCVPPGNTYVVNSSGDAGDSTPGNGTCRTLASATECTLRAAIEEANARPGTQTIAFGLPAGNMVIRVQSGLPSILEPIIIDGTTQPGYDGVTPAVHLSGTQIDTLPAHGFRSSDTVAVTIKALQIENFQFYGIMSNGPLTVDRSVVSGNQIGGIITTGLYANTITASTIRDNGSQDPWTEAGGIEIRQGDVTITDSLITDNLGWKSGGIYLESGTLHLVQSTLTNNIGWDAGGIYVEGYNGNELWVDGSDIGKPGEGNTAAIISDGDKFGGGIYSEGKVHVSDSIVEGNSGAGIHSRGVGGNATLEITNSQILHNSLAGVYATHSDMDIANSQIQYNDNGGIYLAQGSLTVTGSSVSGNQNNGGIHVEAASLLVNKSTISGNTNSDKGGGLYLYATLGTVRIVNSTISGNQAVHDGGGISIIGVIVELNNVTVTLNSAGHGAGLWNGFGTLSVINTIVADNSGGNCEGAITSGGHNLDTRSTCGFSGPGDISDMNAVLGPLQDNGGETKTHALPNNSPALEAGDDATCQKNDQRGVSRPQGLHCDMGAFEAENPVTATPPSVTITPRRSHTPTDTPTATAQKFLFDPVNFSTNLIYTKIGRTCIPKEVTIEVKVSPAELVGSVGLFYRLEEKEGANVTAWGGGSAMIPQGGGWYKLTIYSEDFPDLAKLKGDLWLAVQFIANGPDGQILMRSAVYRQVTVGQCLK